MPLQTTETHSTEIHMFQKARGLFKTVITLILYLPEARLLGLKIFWSLWTQLQSFYITPKYFWTICILPSKIRILWAISIKWRVVLLPKSLILLTKAGSTFFNEPWLLLRNISSWRGGLKSFKCLSKFQRLPASMIASYRRLSVQYHALLFLKTCRSNIFGLCIFLTWREGNRRLNLVLGPGWLSSN